MNEASPDDTTDAELADPGFRAALAAAHTGRWSLSDALWWQRHPEEPGPSGRPSPLSTLRGVQRRVYSAHGDAAGDAAAAQTLRELTNEIAAERALLRAAVAAARQDLQRGDLVTAARASAPAVADGAGEQSDAPAPAAGMPAGATGRRRLRWAAAVLVVVTAAGAGVVLGSVLTPAGDGAAGVSTGASSATPATAPPVASGFDVAATFVTAQRPEDIPTVDTGPTYDPGSFRYLGAIDWAENPDTVGGSPFYAARSRGGRVCLVAVPEGGGYLATCVAESAFPAEGLRLSWLSEGDVGALARASSADGADAEALSDVTVVWGSPDGLSTEMSGRSSVG